MQSDLPIASEAIQKEEGESFIEEERTVPETAVIGSAEIATSLLPALASTFLRAL